MRLRSRGRSTPCFRRGWRVAAAVLTLAVATLPMPGSAQQGEEPQFDALLRQLQGGPARFGALLQVVGQADLGEDDRGEFSIANFRTSVEAELDGGVGFFFQTNFVSSPAILDAILSLRIDERWQLQAGRFKVPFSREFIVSAANIDFVNRARVVEALAPNRQLGAQARLRANGGLELAGGLFTGPRSGASGEAVLVSVRGDWSRELIEEFSALRAGLNVAWGQDGALRSTYGDLDGSALLMGADVRYTRGPLLLAGEAILSNPDLSAPGDPEPDAEWGFQATAGWSFVDNVQGLVRLDHFEPGPFGGSNDLLLGLNVWPTRPTEVQLNIVVPVDGPDRPTQLLLNAQVGF